MKISFTLNGNPVKVEAPATISLLQVLREHLGLTGSKPGCEVGECGACAVILDGLVVAVRNQRVAAYGNYESWHYSQAPRTDDRSAMRITTPLKASCQ